MAMLSRFRLLPPLLLLCGLFAVELRAAPRTHSQKETGLALTQKTLPPSELDALRDLYIATDGDYWLWWNSSYGAIWNFSEPNPNPCTEKWQGVTCDCVSTCHVTQLSLSVHNLSGTLPSTLVDLQDLTFLDLGVNQLVGTISTSIVEFNHLLTLDLHINSLTGTIPQSIGNLSSLLELVLSSNSLTGSIPYSLYDCILLQSIQLQNNNLNGTISDRVSDLSFLNSLQLGSNNFTGPIPEHMGNLRVLTSFVASHNSLSSTLPSSIAKLQNLTLFNVEFNRLNGSIPKEIGHMSSLSTLILSSNYFTDRIPDSLYNLASLSVFQCADNNINGTLSSQIGNLQSLTVFRMELNHLSGSIPAEFGNLTQLKTLSLSINHLISTIPTTLGSLANLETLELTRNGLRGTIPHSLGLLTHMIALSLADNYLTGTLPAVLGDLTSMRSLDLGYNNLKGPIPPSYGHLPNLLTLQLGLCGITGSIPEFLGNLTQLRLLGLQQNLFEHTIPAVLGNLSSLLYVALYDNSLTGTLPESLQNWREIVVFEVYQNQLSGKLEDFFSTKVMSYINVANNLFSGPLPVLDCEVMTYYSMYLNFFSGQIPSILSQSRPLYYLDVGLNILTGPLPTWITDPHFHYFKYFYANNNALSGTIPASWANSSVIFELFLYYNQLSGSIPASLGSLSGLTDLYLQNNRLTGEFPDALIGLTDLTALFIQNNFLHGDLDNAFNSTSQLRLTNIDFSNNSFSGTIPEEIFRLQSLSSFAASSNCLVGSLPEAICEAQSLTGLALDGVSTGTSCRIPLFAAIKYFDAFLAESYLQKGIPSCLFQLPKLQSLHLAGNGLRGNIPDVELSSSLTDFDLSHNLLEGTIPHNFQVHPWVNFDISYNKISGNLEPGFYSIPKNGSLFMEANRISGVLPSSIRYTRNISVLDGNLFDCSLDRAQLPKYDQKAATYNCGSDQVNRSMYVWLVLWLLPLLLLLVIIACRREMKLSATKGFFSSSESAPEASKPENAATNATATTASATLAPAAADEDMSVLETIKKLYYQIGEWRATLKAEYRSSLRSSTASPIFFLSLFISNVRLIFVMLTALIVVLLMPMYATLSTLTPTYKNEYAWKVSGVLLSGLAPGVCLCLAFVFITILVFRWFERMVIRIHRGWRKSKIVDEFFSASTEENVLAMRLGVGLGNFFVMIVVDACYVYIVLNYSLTVVIVTQILMAIFKITWNEVALWQSIPRLRQALAHYRGSQQPIWSFYKMKVTDIDFLLLMNLFNNIIIPILAIAVVSTSCFYNAFFAAPTVTATYSYMSCERFVTVFWRGYVCIEPVESSADSVFSPPFIYSYQCSSALSMNYASVYIFMFIIIGIVQPVYKIGLKLACDHSSWMASRFTSFLPPCLRPLNATGEDHPGPIFEMHRLVVRIDSYLAILLSFGVIFPPLAVVICVAVLAMCLFEEVALGRLLGIAHNMGYFWYRMRVEIECDGIAESFFHTIYMITPFACLMYAYLVFDTLGDQYQWRIATGPAVVLLFFPAIIGAQRKLYNMVFPEAAQAAARKSESERETVVMEMITKNRSTVSLKNSESSGGMTSISSTPNPLVLRELTRDSSIDEAELGGALSTLSDVMEVDRPSGEGSRKKAAVSFSEPSDRELSFGSRPTVAWASDLTDLASPASGEGGEDGLPQRSSLMTEQKKKMRKSKAGRREVSFSDGT